MSAVSAIVLYLSYSFALFLTYTDSINSCPPKQILVPADGRINSHSLESPGYPFSSAVVAKCTTTLTAESNFRLRLTFSDINIGSKNSCSRYKYLKIFDGPNTQARVLAELCQMPRESTQYVSGGNNISLQYENYGRGQPFRGFKVYYTTFSGINDPGWDTEIQAKSTPMYIWSPNYPNYYPTSFYCWWRIRAPATHRIRLQSDYFTIERHLLGCTNGDYLAIYDGSRKSSPFLDTACGNDGVNVISSGPALYLEFTTNWRNPYKYKGFKLQFNYITDTIDCIQDTIMQLTALDAPSYFVTRNYPRKYPTFSYCQWNITTRDPNYVVKLAVIDSELSRDCKSGEVTAYDGKYSLDQYKIQSWCDDEKPTLYSTGRSMFIFFTANGNQQYRGFKIQYSQTNSPPPVAPASKNVPVGAIVGGFFGALALIAVVVVIGVILYCRRDHSSTTSSMAFHVRDVDRFQSSSPDSYPPPSAPPINYHNTLSDFDTYPDYSDGRNGAQHALPSSDMPPSYEDVIGNKEAYGVQ